MVSTDNTQRDEPRRRQGIVDAQNRRHRSIIADAIKQMVLIMISLGLPIAYTHLAKPDKVAEGDGLHFFHLSPTSLVIFAIYVFIGTRFLLTSWLYLSTTYRDDNPRKLRILPDAIGIFLIGVLIGVQSCYASEKSMTDFFMLFCLVLIIDVVSSIASVGMNWQAIKGEGLYQELCWIGNNAIFGTLTFIAVPKSPPFYLADSTAHLLMAYALLNCAISFLISWFGYFRAQRIPSKHGDHDLVAVVLAKRDGDIRVEEARRWLSASFAREDGRHVG
jgi:hypothetical protein